MRRRKYYKITRRRKKRGKCRPHVYKNKVYLGKIPQTGTEAVCRVITRLLENVGDIGL